MDSGTGTITLHTTSLVHDTIDPGVVNVTFVEDVSAVPFTTNNLEDVDSGSSSDAGITRINAHLVQFVSTDTSFGEPGDLYLWHPPAGYVVAPPGGLIS